MARWELQLVNSVPASAFDAAARERVGELLRVTRDSNPTRLTAGTVVEFIHNGQLRCGCLKAARAALSEGRRYWCLKWLSEHLTSRVTGWVAARRGAGCLVLLDELPMSAWVPADNGLSARVGDRVTVANSRVHVRGDEVIFTDPRIEPPLESGSG